MTTEELTTFRTEVLPSFITAWISNIKERAGYDASITAYDTEIQDLMGAAVLDMLTAGVPSDMFPEDTTTGIDKRVINAIALYVQAYIEQDRSDTNRYLSLFKRLTFKLSLEDGGGWDHVESSD